MGAAATGLEWLRVSQSCQDLQVQQEHFRVAAAAPWPGWQGVNLLWNKELRLSRVQVGLGDTQGEKKEQFLVLPPDHTGSAG